MDKIWGKESIINFDALPEETPGTDFLCYFFLPLRDLCITGCFHKMVWHFNSLFIPLKWSWPKIPILKCYCRHVNINAFFFKTSPLLGFGNAANCKFLKSLFSLLVSEFSSHSTITAFKPGNIGSFCMRFHSDLCSVLDMGTYINF